MLQGVLPLIISALLKFLWLAWPVQHGTIMYKVFQTRAKSATLLYLALGKVVMPTFLHFSSGLNPGMQGEGHHL